MHPHRKVLIKELELIRDNVQGGIKKNSEIDLTHSEVISFCRAFVMAVENQMINPFCDLDSDDKNQVMFYVNLIRCYGIPHCDRSRIAGKCVSFLESIETKKKLLADTQNNEEWDSIPF